MIMKKRSVILLVLCLIMTITGQVLAENKPMGSFHIAFPEPLKEKNDDPQYIPIDEVADTIGFELEWKFDNKKITGHFANMYFSSDNYLIANGHLYLPVNIFVNVFGLEIKMKGNNIFIYRKKEILPDLELDLNINKSSYNRKEPLAVSILLMNKSNRNVTLQHSSTMEYDLVLERYNNEIWRLSHNKHDGTVISINRLYPDEYILYTEIINPSENI